LKSRERVRRTLTFEHYGRVPRQVWLLPWAEKRYPGAVRRLRDTYPDDIIAAPAVYAEPLKTEGDRYAEGRYVDEWGCVFENLHGGVIGIVREPRISRWEDLEGFETPDAALHLDREAVNAFCRGTDRFVIAGSVVRPFERLQFLRTLEMALMDLAEQPSEFFVLLDRIHEHYCKEVEVWAQTEVDAVALMDDWGVQNSLMVSPKIFCDLFKPMYKDYVDIARRYGKYVFMHSDGFITDIIGDLVEVGVDALNSQVFCMGVEALGERYRGRITFWGEIDRQQILSRGSTEEVRQAVASVRESLYDKGGVIAQCEFGPGAKPENILAVFDAWDALSKDEAGTG
jgi:hypothetical protein